MIHSMSQEKLGFYLYKRGDHETKAPYMCVAQVRKAKVNLKKLLKAAITDDLVLIDNPGLKISKANVSPNRSIEFNDSKEDVSFTLKPDYNCKYKDKFKQHLQEIRKMHIASQ